MKKYAKLLPGGGIEFAPTNYNGVSNWINDEQAVLAEGYFPVEIPKTPQGMLFKKYVMNDGIITAEFEPCYAAQRRAEYPSIEEQLDMQYWDKHYGTSIWYDTISAIKAKYPKPTVLSKQSDL
jgi:hypothetical protein